MFFKTGKCPFSISLDSSVSSLETYLLLSFRACRVTSSIWFSLYRTGCSGTPTVLFLKAENTDSHISFFTFSCEEQFSIPHTYLQTQQGETDTLPQSCQRSYSASWKDSWISWHCFSFSVFCQCWIWGLYLLMWLKEN